MADKRTIGAYNIQKNVAVERNGLGERHFVINKVINGELVQQIELNDEEAEQFRQIVEQILGNGNGPMKYLVIEHRLVSDERSKKLIHYCQTPEEVKQRVRESVIHSAEWFSPEYHDWNELITIIPYNVMVDAVITIESLRAEDEEFNDIMSGLGVETDNVDSR